MKGRPIDLVGQRFDRLVVVEQAGTSPGGRLCLCRCDCGSEIVKPTTSLRRRDRGFTGCRICEPMSRASVHVKHGGAYGGKGHLYRIWKGIRARCENPAETSYRYYGAIGIKRCAEWNDFATFREWAMHNGYREGLSIDRINPYGNYEQTNCRWVTRSENSRGPKRKRVAVA